MAAIEKAKNVTIDVLERYVDALGGTLHVIVVKGNRRIPLLGAPATTRKPSPTGGRSSQKKTSTPKTIPSTRQEQKST